MSFHAMFMVVCCTAYRVAMDTPTVAYGQLLRHEQDEKVAMSNQEEVEVNDAGQSSEPLEGGGDEEKGSLGPRLVIQCTVHLTGWVMHEVQSAKLYVNYIVINDVLSTVN